MQLARPFLPRAATAPTGPRHRHAYRALIALVALACRDAASLVGSPESAESTARPAALLPAPVPPLPTASSSAPDPVSAACAARGRVAWAKSSAW